VLLDFRQLVQIQRPGEFDDIERLPVNDLALLRERNEEILSFSACRNHKPVFLCDEDGRSRLCGFVAGLELDNQIVFHVFIRLSLAAPGQA